MSSPVPDPSLISADAAARALQEHFLANADRGAASTTPAPRFAAAAYCVLNAQLADGVSHPFRPTRAGRTL